MHPIYFRSFLLLLLLSFPLASRSQGNMTNKTFVIQHVNIIPMTLENTIIRNATVVIAGNKIQSINKPFPDSAEVIEGEGKWLIPGLVDMHVHTLANINFGTAYPTQGATFFPDNQDFMTLFIANGVTTIFDLNSRVEHFQQRNEIAKGDVIGPRMALAALINGGNGDGIRANTPSDGRQTVRIAKAEGYGFIKVYSDLNVETFKAIVEEADKQGMKVVGHIPNAFKGRIAEAFIPHFGMVAHAEEYAKQSQNYSDEDIRYFAKLAKENNTWLIPTLTVIERTAGQARSLDSVRNLPGFPYIHPLMQDKWITANKPNKGTSPERVTHLEKMIDFNNRLVKIFKEEGVPIVAGTDAGCSGVVWGFSLHDELELLVKAGLSPEEALASATRLPAHWLGIQDKTGTVEAGKYADIILLDANPLNDINNVRNIFGVFFNGRWIDRATIDKMLSELAKKNAANRGKYKWNKRREH